MLWLILPALLVLWIAILCVRAARLKPEPRTDEKAPEMTFDRDKAVRDLQTLIRFRTVSYEDSALEDPAQFEQLIASLPALFPNVHKACAFTMPGPRSLVFHWKGQAHDKPGVLMAHFDVVPVDESGWDKPAFEGIIEDGVMWGRGTLDTKCTFLAVLEAAEHLIAQGHTPSQDLYLCFSGSEEINGDGAPAIIRWFQSQKIHLDFVLDEGGAIVEKVFPGVTQPVAVIGIAEKGTMSVRLSVPTGGGHASTPPAMSSIGRLARAVRRMEQHPFPARMSDAAESTFLGMSKHAPFALRLLFANLWCFRPLLYLACRLMGGELNALVRTTVAFTQMEGSSAFNVMPSNPHMVCNVRINVGETTESVLERFRKVIHDDKIALEMPFGRNPSPTSTFGDAPWQRIEKAVHMEYPGTVVTPYLMLASSDSWHYSAVSEHVYRFSPMPMSKEERGMIHGKNERIPLTSIHSLVSFYMRLIRMC